MNDLMVQNRPLTVADVVAQVQLIQQVMEKVMKKDVHFGIIPGCKKPSLWKPGAEKLLSTFQLVPDNPIIEDLSSEDEIRYRVTQRILRMNDGMLVGSASGECSSEEEKYKWRKPTCAQEWDETAEDRKRAVWKNATAGPYQTKQVRTHPKDVANTILKMAVKRALVAVTLEVTATSDIFDQDLEDLPEGMMGQEEHSSKPPISQPKAKPDTKPTAEVYTSITTGISKITPKTGKGPHRIMDGAGTAYNTFSDTFKATAEEAQSAGLKVKITYKKSQYGLDIESMEKIEGPEPES